MRKVMTFLGAVIISFSMVGVVYAGDLNEYEKNILESAKETYEYKGESYRVSQYYLKQLENYLMEDHIDINAADKDLILQMAYDSIELGVNEGYLFPIEHFDSQEEQIQTVTKANEEETIKELLEAVGKDMSDIESYLPLSTDDVSISANPLDNSIKDVDSTTDIPSAEATESINSTTDIPNTATESINSATNIPNTATEAISSTANIPSTATETSFDNIYDKKSTEDEIIKKTGFHLNYTLYTVIGLVVLMIYGIIIALRNNYFSNNTNEQKH